MELDAEFLNSKLIAITFDSGENHLSQPDAVAHGGEHARCGFDFFPRQPHRCNQGCRDEEGVLGAFVTHNP